MKTTLMPFNLAVQPSAFDLFQGARRIIRHLSDMRDLYIDQEAMECILAVGDPIIYEFWEVEYEGSDGGLCFGITRIHPGKVGREYHMTKGHFHTTQGDEVYVVMEGQGLLLLQTREGKAATIEMTPGHMCYVPAKWAHRTVNTGDHDLIFLSIWPPHIEHDYQTVAQSGFPQFVVEGTDGPTVIENAS